MRILPLLATLLAQPALAQDPVIAPFTEETVPSGFIHRFTGEWEFMVGGGTAVFDCSGDGLPDVFAAGGTAPAALFRNDSARGGALALTRIDSGLEDTGVSGAYPLDVDGDGLLDLALLRVGPDRLMRGLGDCRFRTPLPPGASTGWTSGPPPSPPPGNAGQAGPPSPSAPTSTARKRPSPGATAPPTTSTARRHRLRHPPLPLTPGSAPDSSSSPTGIARAPPTCGSRTTANTTRADRNRCGGWNPASPPWPLPKPMAAAPAHLGHGHRPGRPHLRRLPRVLPDLDGRQQAADAGRHSRRSPRRSPATATSPSSPASPRTAPIPAATPPLHRLARAIRRRRQQRRPLRPLRRQGQRLGHARLCRG